MNVFYVDNDPKISAQCLVDKHVVKMIVESAQILSTNIRLLESHPDMGLYRATHINHPCTIWSRSSSCNYQWLYDHYISLLEEYTFRYGKKHQSSSLINLLREPPLKIPSGILTTPALAMPNEYKIIGNPVESYRNYYRLGKSHIHKWTKRNAPSWIKNNGHGSGERENLINS